MTAIQQLAAVTEENERLQKRNKELEDEKARHDAKAAAAASPEFKTPAFDFEATYRLLRPEQRATMRRTHWRELGLPKPQ